MKKLIEKRLAKLIKSYDSRSLEKRKKCAAVQRSMAIEQAEAKRPPLTKEEIELRKIEEQKRAEDFADLAVLIASTTAGGS